MRYIRSINEQWVTFSDLIKLERELESEVRDIFIELEDIGYEVKIVSKFKNPRLKFSNNNQIEVTIDNEANRRVIDKGIAKDNFEMLLDFINEKYEVIGHEYSYSYIFDNYISSLTDIERKNLDPYQFQWSVGESKDFPYQLKYVVRLVLKIEFK